MSEAMRIYGRESSTSGSLDRTRAARGFVAMAFGEVCINRSGLWRKKNLYSRIEGRIRRRKLGSEGALQQLFRHNFCKYYEYRFHCRLSTMASSERQCPNFRQKNTPSTPGIRQAGLNSNEAAIYSTLRSGTIESPDDDLSGEWWPTAGTVSWA